MQISKLKLSGFKSFVEPAELRVEPGLTGVVGPNGCGKSNLLEAIRWVMGENSPKSMRSGGMEDVIFAGTESRPQRDFAEVLLQAEDDSGEELIVTRRIERGVGSAYRVNGNDVRAKDVALTFADAATGAHSPALVSQGKIAQVIAAKPAERRQMLEEAAGIAGLHVRRRDAENKLRQTERNLARLEDIMAGLDSQIAALRRQAKQAERYKKLSAQINTAEARLLFARWRDAADAARAARAAAQAADAQVAAHKDEADQALSVQINAASALEAARDELADRRDDASAHGHRMAALTSQLEAAEERLADLDKQKQRLEEDRIAAGQLAKDAAAALSRLKSELAASGTALGDAEQHAPQLSAKLEQAERASSAAELALANATADHAGIEAEWRVAEAQIDQTKAQLSRIETEAERLAAQRAQLGAQSDPALAVDKAEARLETLRTQIETSRQHLEQGREEKAALQSIRDEAAIALAGARAELAGVEREHKALTRDRETQKKHAKQRQGLPSALEGITVKPGFERAIAAVLGRDAKSPLGSPDAEDEGRFWAGRSEPPPPVEGSILEKLKHCPPELRARLSLVHYAEEDDARRLNPGEWLVTHKGHLRRWDGFVARGEGAGEAARLEAANRLTQLDAMLPKQRSALQNAQSTEEQAQSNLQTLSRDLVARERALGEVIEEERQALRALDAAQADAERTTRRLAEIDAARADLAQQLEAARSEHEAAQASHAQLPAPDAARAALDAARSKHEAARTGLQSASAMLAAHEQEVAVARERAAAQHSEMQGWEARSGDAVNRLAAAERLAEEIETERTIIAAKPESLMAEIEQGDSVRAKLTQELHVAEERVAQAQEQVASADAALTNANEALSLARENRAGLTAKADSEESRRSELARISGERFQCPPPVLSQRFDFADEDIGPSTQESTELDRLSASRERIGPVNLVAAEELERIEAEHGANASEQAELTEAVARLRGSIGSLNREGRERLRAAFHEVDNHFRELFTRLFQGGQAHLALIDSDDPLEAGLEIYAQPPGKKLQSLSLLSGGEQALTATALIFALFLTNPAPICVLDEVDAPLDDANIERFCDLLDSMVRTTTTRYLIVTHNAVTMSRMHRLFGVTMAEQGVSRLVSVDLGEAELMAAE